MKRILALVLTLLTLLSLFPVYAASQPQPGDILLVTVSSAPLYASYNTYDYTVITNVPQGSTVMYIASVAKGYCVAYQNFVGYIKSSYLTPATSSYYRFRMPDGSAYSAVVGGNESVPSWGYPQVTPTPTPTPMPPYYDWGSGWQPSVTPTPDPALDNPRVPTMDFTAVPVKAIKNIYTRSGPGTYYTSPGQFGSGKSYVAFYQTKNDSTSWSYIEFSQDGEKYRAYTPSNRFDKNSAADFETENVIYITITEATPLYYGPGYDYAQSSYGKIYAHSSIRAFYQENGWVLIEYLLSSGETHRGWVPAGCWHD